MAQLPFTFHVLGRHALGTPDSSQTPEYLSNLETHIDYAGQMFYERFQNLDLDKAELED